MSAPAAKPGAYALIHFDNKPQVYSDMVSIFITGVIAGLIQIAIWWTSPGIGGKFGFIAHCACLPMHLFTKWRNDRRERKAALEDNGVRMKEIDSSTDDIASSFEMKPAKSEPDDEDSALERFKGGAPGDEPDPENERADEEISSVYSRDSAAGVFGEDSIDGPANAVAEPEEEANDDNESGVVIETLQMPRNRDAVEKERGVQKIRSVSEMQGYL
mmetsp:Transcript_12838/g.10949  ORF Transcript_12838/g.10949 Transcript_12838/m.10949 type:complete len:216 (-) Transcript_12838:270-917(-)